MKAAVLLRTGKADGAFEIRDVQTPEPSFGQLLVQIEAFGLNFADVLARTGLYREAPPLPSILGYDMVGRVVAIGEGVDKAWLHKRVAGLTRFGSYAQFIATPAIGCVEIPESMPALDACALGTQYVTAYYSCQYLQQARKGERVLVHAATGGVGTALIQLLRNQGCEIFATAGSDQKITELEKKGIRAVNYRTQNYEEVIQSWLGERLHVSFNSIAGTTFKKDMNLLGAGGRLVLYGFSQRSGQRGGKLATLQLLWNMGIVLPIMTMATSKSILGVNMLKIADHEPQIIQSCLQSLVKLWEEGIIQPVNGGEYTIDQISMAHRDLEERRIQGKSIVRW